MLFCTAFNFYEGVESALLGQAHDLVVVDFTSAHPIVISGSHNLLMPASSGNGENFLILRADTDMADCYGVELVRIYDHSRFRWAVKQGAEAPTLIRDDLWTERYSRPNSLWWRDRRYFAGGA